MHDYERRIIEQVHSWRDIAHQVPFLKFPPSWEVRITPAFGSVDARFAVREGRAHVSVYLDWYGNAGAMDEPYWEIHPIDGDCARYLLNETDELLAGIAQSIREQNEAPQPAGEGSTPAAIGEQP